MTNSELGLKTRHVFLDTEVYRRFGHNLRHKVLQRFLEHIKSQVCALHITDITIGEITRQIHENAKEVADAVNKGNKALRRWYGRKIWYPEPTVPEDLSDDDLAGRVTTDFRIQIRTLWDAQVHDAMNVPAKEVFEAYFRGDAPFDKADSKEFPDAFVIAALDRWCTREHELMYVVTNDQAMLRAVAATKTLLPIPSIDDLLQIITEAHNPQIVDRVREILKNNWEEIEQQVADHVPTFGTIYRGDLHDGEIVHHDIGNGQTIIREFHVISANEERIEAVMRVRVNVEFEVQYLDTDSASYDSAEGGYIGGDTETETFESDVTISVLAVIDATDDSVSDLEFLTRDISLREPYENYK